VCPALAATRFLVRFANGSAGTEQARSAQLCSALAPRLLGTVLAMSRSSFLAAWRANTWASGVLARGREAAVLLARSARGRHRDAFSRRLPLCAASGRTVSCSAWRFCLSAGPDC